MSVNNVQCFPQTSANRSTNHSVSSRQRAVSTTRIAALGETDWQKVSMYNGRNHTPSANQTAGTTPGKAGGKRTNSPTSVNVNRLNAHFNVKRE
ncbi:hypothetical protein CEXT_294471 [Caerostris extrusa]|uniref:Uncharacterized protein n=1 Tax=Caerostris extrusa TaxID=172846 RepID=A0AAV4QML9_CAEEX|nr:hypothetical protein CEXT_294471 [Caerostris extrusa]